MRERNYRTYRLLLLTADVIHYSVTSVATVPKNTPASHALQLSIEAHTGTPPAADLPSAGSSTENMVAASGRSASLLVLPRSQAKIVRCGGRYDPQLVKRSSE